MIVIRTTRFTFTCLRYPSTGTGFIQISWDVRLTCRGSVNFLSSSANGEQTILLIHYFKEAMGKEDGQRGGISAGKLNDHAVQQVDERVWRELRNLDRFGQTMQLLREVGITAFACVSTSGWLCAHNSRILNTTASFLLMGNVFFISTA